MNCPEERILKNRRMKLNAEKVKYGTVERAISNRLANPVLEMDPCKNYLINEREK